MNNIVQNLFAIKPHLLNTLIRDTHPLDEEICDLINNGKLEPLQNKISQVAYENLSAIITLKNALSHVSDDTTCVFVHGSTGKGLGQIAPNIHFELHTHANGQVTMHTSVIPECRDDIDLVCITGDITTWEQRFLDMKSYFTTNGIDITINIVTPGDAVDELCHPDTPALRRIFLFNRPKCIIGDTFFGSLQHTAHTQKTHYDLAYELDFRVLMHVAQELTRNENQSYNFDAEELLLLFPSLYHTHTQQLHVGFPRKRRKLIITQ